MSNILCIILTIIIVILLIKAFTNEGKLWNKDEYYFLDSEKTCLNGKFSPNTGKKIECTWRSTKSVGCHSDTCGICTCNWQ